MNSKFANFRYFMDRFGLPVCLLIALILRVVKIQSAYYGKTGELYRDLLIEYHFLTQHQWPLLGPQSSLGAFHFGPAYYYLLAPGIWMFHFAPAGAILTSVLFSVLSIWVLYYLVKLWFADSNMALISAFLLSVSFFDIENASYVSNPNLLPFFVLSSWYCFTLIVQGKARFWHQIGFALSLAIATQLHATALAFLPLSFVVLIIWNKTVIPFRNYFIWAIVGAAVYSPYLLFEFQNNFSNTQSIISIGQTYGGFLPGVNFFASYIKFWMGAFLLQNEFFRVQNFSLLAFWFLFVVLCAITGIFLAWWMKNKPKLLKLQIPELTKRNIIIWMLVSTTILLFFHFSLPSYYFLILWPLPIILFTWFMWWLKQNRGPWIFVCSTFVLFQIIQLCYFYGSVDKQEFSHPRMLELFQKIKSDSGPNSYTIINNFADLNLFVYYEELTHMHHTGSTDNIYVISSGTTPQMSLTGKYIQKSQWPDKPLLITKYQAK